MDTGKLTRLCNTAPLLLLACWLGVGFSLFLPCFEANGTLQLRFNPASLLLLLVALLASYLHGQHLRSMVFIILAGSLALPWHYRREQHFSAVNYLLGAGSGQQLQLQGCVVRSGKNWAWLRIEQAAQHGNSAYMTETAQQCKSDAVARLQGLLLELRGHETLAMLKPGDQLQLQGYLERIEAEPNFGCFDRRSWMSQYGVFVRCVPLGLRVDEQAANVWLPARRGHERLLGILTDAQHAACYPDWMQRGLQVVASVVLGQNSAIDPQVLQAFQWSGSLHVFAVSGMNIAMLALLLWRGLFALRLPARACLVLMILALPAYAMVTLYAVSAMRAACMLSLLLVGFLLQRHAGMANRLGAAFCILLAADGDHLRQTGFQLSFGVIVALFVASGIPSLLPARLFKATLALPHSPGYVKLRLLNALLVFLRLLEQSLLASLLAWLATLPILAANFGFMFPYGVFCSVLLVPLVFLIMLLGLLLILLSLCGVSLYPVVCALALCGESCYRVADFWAGLPAARLNVRGAMPEGYLLIPCLPHGEGALCLSSPRVLIDCGKGNSLQHRLQVQLAYLGLDPEYLILSHRDSEHYSGVLLAQKYLGLAGTYANFKLPAKLQQQLPAVPQALRWQQRYPGKDSFVQLLWPCNALLRKADHDCAIMLWQYRRQRVLIAQDASALALWEFADFYREHLQVETLIIGQPREGAGLELDFLLQFGIKRVFVQSRLAETQLFSRDFLRQCRQHGIELISQYQRGAILVCLRGDKVSWKSKLRTPPEVDN